jgi:hypothetical protein
MFPPACLRLFVSIFSSKSTRLPIPNGPLTIGIDGGFIRDQRDKGWFEVIAGKSVLEFRRDEAGQNKSSKCFGFVQRYDDRPKRRLFEVLKSQGMQENQQVVLIVSSESFG